MALEVRGELTHKESSEDIMVRIYSDIAWLVMLWGRRYMKKKNSSMISRILAWVAAWIVESLSDTEKHNKTILTVKINWFHLRYMDFYELVGDSHGGIQQS